jgi:hypothetical protein
LAVAFARPDGSYALALENHTLIPRRESSCFDDALEEGNVSITHGTMNLTLHRFASTGTWEMGDATYTFRWQNKRFELIGYDDMSVMRNSGEISEISINFMTRKAKLSSGHVSKDSPNKVTWVKLGSSRRWTPDEIGQGSGFSVRCLNQAGPTLKAQRRLRESSPSMSRTTTDMQDRRRTSVVCRLVRSARRKYVIEERPPRCRRTDEVRMAGAGKSPPLRRASRADPHEIGSGRESGALA